MQIETEWLTYALLVSIIAFVYLWIGAFERRFWPVENKWDGFVGGIAVGYVALFMLPKLGMTTYVTYGDGEDGWVLSQYRAYYLLLASIAVYMIVERAERASPKGEIAARWTAITIQALYSFLMGYVAVEMPLPGLGYHVLANVILALHLMGMLHHLRAHHPKALTGAAPYVFTLLVIAGYTAGIVTELPYGLVMSGTAIVAGVILVDVIGDELPRGKTGRLSWFLCGVVMFAVVATFLRSS
jgi:hypothetical protein